MANRTELFFINVIDILRYIKNCSEKKRRILNRIYSLRITHVENTVVFAL